MSDCMKIGGLGEWEREEASIEGGGEKRGEKMYAIRGREKT